MPEGHGDSVSQAIEVVVDRFRRMVQSVSRRHGLVDADLEEVLQDVRIRLWRAKSTSSTLDSLGSSYVYQAARSAALDLIQRRRQRATDSYDPHSTVLSSVPDASPAPDAHLTMQESVAALAEALDALAPDRRAAVQMHLAGYDRSEIAAVLGWSDTKTRNLLHRGLTDLRARLHSSLERERRDG